MKTPHEIAYELIVESADCNGDEIQGYRGRGMDRECLAIYSDSSITTIMFDLGMEFARWRDEAQDSDLADKVVMVLQRVEQDSLGKSDKVIYWPRLEWKEE